MSTQQQYKIPVPSQVLSMNEPKKGYLESLGSILPNHVNPKHVAIGVAIGCAWVMGGAAAVYYYHKYKTNKKFALSDQLPTRNRQIFNGSGNSTEGVLILHQCPRGRKTPAIAPYPFKLETFLRVHGIKYEVNFNSDEPRNGESPWITLDLEDICDSQNCIRFLCEKYNIEIDKGIDDNLKSIGRAYNHLLENHLYWGIALWRWVYDGARNLSDIQLLPTKTLDMIPSVCRTVEQAAWFHGLGKKAPRDVIEAVCEDLQALSDFLGEKKFFLSDEIVCEVDCTAFSMLAQMLWNMDGSPYNFALKESFPNLTEFCWRMRNKFWPDWDQLLNNEAFDE